MVDHPLTFTYPELVAMPLFEQYVTLACVSNTVGGDLIGNTLWTGVHLKEVLARAGGNRVPRRSSAAGSTDSRSAFPRPGRSIRRGSR